MPYKFEYTHMKIPKKLDRRRSHLTPEDRMRIKENIHNKSQHELAKEYKVSRSLIQIILNPERGERIKELARKRRKDGRYYDREKHTDTVRRHRQYKKSIVDDLQS